MTQILPYPGVGQVMVVGRGFGTLVEVKECLTREKRLLLVEDSLLEAVGGKQRGLVGQGVAHSMAAS